MLRTVLPSFLAPSRSPLVLVATDPVWVGGVKQTLRRQEGQRGELLPLVCPDSLKLIPSSEGRQFCLVQVGRSSLAEIADWILAQRPYGHLRRVAVLFDRLGGNHFAEQERPTVATLLHEAGAIFTLASLWELPPVLERATNWVGESHAKNADPLAELPLSLGGVGWQAGPIRV